MQGLMSHVKASGFYSKSVQVLGKGLGEEKDVLKGSAGKKRQLERQKARSDAWMDVRDMFIQA